MTDDELKKLAVDIVEGRIFGSWMLPQADLPLIGSVFMPLSIGGSEKLPDDVSCLYEYLDKAMPLSVNGYPTFWSFRFFTHTDRERLVPMIERYKEMKKEFLDARTSPGINSDSGDARQPGADQG